MSKEFERLGFNVYSTDLIDRGYGETGIDFLKSKREDIPFKTFSIITNPPFSLAENFITHSMNILKDGEKCAMFLKILFMESNGRKNLFKQYPPRIYICSNRIKCGRNGDFYERDKTGNILYKKDGTPKLTSSAVGYAWYVFEKGWQPKEGGGGIINWIN